MPSQYAAFLHDIQLTSCRVIVQILKEPLAADRHCPHNNCTSVLASCSAADYPADRDALALVSHHSFSFSSGAHAAHAPQASSALASVASTASGGSDALDPASHWAALQRIDSGGRQQSSQHEAESPSKPEHHTTGAGCKPILTSVPSALIATHCSGTLSERTISGSPLQQDHRAARGTTFTPVRRNHAPSRAATEEAYQRASHSRPHWDAKPLPSYNSVPATTAACSSQVHGGRSIRRAISLQPHATAQPRPSTENPASLLLSQVCTQILTLPNFLMFLAKLGLKSCVQCNTMHRLCCIPRANSFQQRVLWLTSDVFVLQPSAVVITVVDSNKQKLKMLLHGTHLTVEDVKEQIYEQMGNPVREQRLVYKGILLTNAHMLATYGIGQKAQLQLDAASFRATL